MKTILKHTVEIILMLSKEEAQWLKLTMQNPLHDTSLEDEDEFDKENRKKIFESLKDALYEKI